jgi:hypothetical protein
VVPGRPSVEPVAAARVDGTDGDAARMFDDFEHDLVRVAAARALTRSDADLVAGRSRRPDRAVHALDLDGLTGGQPVVPAPAVLRGRGRGARERGERGKGKACGSHDVRFSGSAAAGQHEVYSAIERLHARRVCDGIILVRMYSPGYFEFKRQATSSLTI